MSLKWSKKSTWPRNYPLLVVTGYYYWKKTKNILEKKLSDKDVASLSKQKFRNYLLKKATQLTVKYLKKLKGEKSKSIHLDVSDTTICTYLIDGRFSREERELLFWLRSRTINVKSNFPNAFLNNNMLCEICKIFPCTQSHLLQCPALTSKLIVDSTVKLNDSFVYGNVEQQLIYVKIYAEFWKIREEVVKEKKKQENVTTLWHQSHQHIDLIFCVAVRLLFCTIYLSMDSINK